MRTIDDITKEQRTKRGIALLVALFWFWVSTLPLPVSEQKRVDHLILQKEYITDPIDGKDGTEINAIG